MEIDKIYNKDCLDVMRQIPNESIDLVLTDPPYRVTSRGGSNCSMSGYWIEERTRKGKIFAHNDIDIKEMRQIDIVTHYVAMGVGFEYSVKLPDIVFNVNIIVSKYLSLSGSVLRPIS